MDRIFVFCYFMKFDPKALRTLIPAQITYWEKHAPENFSGGPFNDRSGGMITFSAPDQQTAEIICREDPFIKEGIVDAYWVREWLVSHRR